MSDISGGLPGSALETLGHPPVSQAWDKRALRGATAALPPVQPVSFCRSTGRGSPSLLAHTACGVHQV